MLGFVGTWWWWPVTTARNQVLVPTAHFRPARSGAQLGTYGGWRGTSGVGVRLAGAAQHVAALDHVGACSAAAAATAVPTATPIASASPAAATASAAAAGTTGTAGGAGDNRAARCVHGHRAAAGHCLRGGRRANLGGRARGFIVAGACCLCVQWRLRVWVGAGATREDRGRRATVRMVRTEWPRCCQEFYEEEMVLGYVADPRAAPIYL